MRENSGQLPRLPLDEFKKDPQVAEMRDSVLKAMRKYIEVINYGGDKAVKKSLVVELDELGDKLKEFGISSIASYCDSSGSLLPQNYRNPRALVEMIVHEIVRYIDEVDQTLSAIGARSMAAEFSDTQPASDSLSFAVLPAESPKRLLNHYAKLQIISFYQSLLLDGNV